MRAYYLHARSVVQVADRLLDTARVPARKKPRIRDIDSSFLTFNGERLKVSEQTDIGLMNIGTGLPTPGLSLYPGAYERLDDAWKARIANLRLVSGPAPGPMMWCLGPPGCPGARPTPPSSEPLSARRFLIASA